MPYSTYNDLVLKFTEESIIQLTDDERDGTKVQERVEYAIEGADQEIDGYLTGRYVTPLDIDPIPFMIRDISSELAIYQLYQRQGETILDDARQNRYDNAIKRLEDIQAGTITFVGDGSPNNSCAVSTQAKVYTSEFLDKY